MAEFYNTGLIDSRKVQEKYGILFREIMEKLKAQLFADYKNPFIIANSFSIAENACLKDMESIYLVVHDTERGFRLSQACDVSNIFPNSWDEQTQEKGNISCDVLRRGTEPQERDQFGLGLGEHHYTINENVKPNIKPNEGVRRLTSTFWSCEDAPLGGYGSITTTTHVMDINKIADIDLTSLYEWIIDENIDDTSEWYDNLWYNIVEDCNLDDQDDIIKYIQEKEGYNKWHFIQSPISKIEQIYSYLHEFIQDTEEETSEEKINEKLKKRGIPIEEMKKVVDWYNSPASRGSWNTIPEYMEWVKLQNEVTKFFSNVTNQFWDLFTAGGALTYIKELNTVYHPWVTVAEIQAHRVYDPPAASSNSKTNLVMKLKF